MQTIYITSHYGWDQDDKNIKLYLSIPNAEKIHKENYNLRVDTRSIQLAIEDHEGVNYDFKLSKLCGDLDTKGTIIKFKPKRVIIYLRKKEFGKRWNDIKAKKIGDVYNQMQRQMDQEKESLQNATRCTLDPFNITDIVTSSHHHQS